MNKHICMMGVVVVAIALTAFTVGRTAEPKSPEFPSVFNVDKANLASVGRNPYFPLAPGHCLYLKGDNTTLRVTVLRETKMVDGVETRVVEEREEKDGQLIELSRNYFAVDKNSNDVYYFGEDVNIYKDGKIMGHEGSWLSGIDGAKFGMMMPGKPKVGDKFQQEIAPKTAMDRCEIVAVGAQIATPAGPFKKCLRTKDTSLLEKGVSEKAYAPGIGLIKDDECALVKVAKAAAKKKAEK
jgi:hypothetical protein